MFKAGIDVGSRSIELVVLKEREIYLKTRQETSFDYVSQVNNMLNGLDLDATLVTGYGRHLVSRKLEIGHVTEIKAYAAGVRCLYPDAKAILDIGGQDTKAILLDENGRVVRFEMNDRCAAGTGRFLEIMAQALGCTVMDLAELALSGRHCLAISSMCTVFAETEVVALMAKGTRAQDVARALVRSVARRSSAMLRRIGATDKVVFCGGVARNTAVHKELEDILGTKVEVPEEPDYAGALGAALLAN